MNLVLSFNILVCSVSSGAYSLRFSFTEGLKEDLDRALQYAQEALGIYPEYQGTTWEEWTTRLAELACD